MTVRSRLEPGEVETMDDVHDMCRVAVAPITVDDPWQTLDWTATDGAWNLKHQIVAMHKGRCPHCGNVENLLQLAFRGSFYATGKIIPASLKTKPREIWECRMWGYKRVRTRFKYLFGVRVCT